MQSTGQTVITDTADKDVVKLDKRKVTAGILILTGIVILAVPFYWHFKGAGQTDKLMEAFEREIETQEETEDEEEKEQTGISEADAALLSQTEVIGILEIESIGIRYPVMEGTGSAVLNTGIGHITETAAIGEMGNCVLCGHNGSRYGTFFTPLNQVQEGAVVTVLDKEGVTHSYEVTETFVISPYDNSIKNQSDTEELTLFTCAESGTKRFVVKCIPVEQISE